jgi:prepilin-type N-terminal cleavage/methylation domain-containing protein
MEMRKEIQFKGENGFPPGTPVGNRKGMLTFPGAWGSKGERKSSPLQPQGKEATGGKNCKPPGTPNASHLPRRRKSQRYISMVPVTIANARPKRGFTMVEILVAIGLLTLSLAIATPYVQKQAINANLKSAVRALESDIFDLKQRAITENMAFAIVFDPSANTYTIQQDGATVQIKTPTVFGSDIQITSAPFGGGNTLSFQTGGTTTSGSITLTNGRGSTAIISINIAGRTYVQYNML